MYEAKMYFQSFLKKFFSSFVFLTGVVLAFHLLIWWPTVAQSTCDLQRTWQRTWVRKVKTTQATKNWCKRKSKKFTLLSIVSIAWIIYLWLKKNFFQEWASKKKFFTRTFLVDPVGWRQVNLFLSLGLYKNFSKMQYINAIRAKLTILWFSDCL